MPNTKQTLRLNTPGQLKRTPTMPTAPTHSLLRRQNKMAAPEQTPEEVTEDYDYDENMPELVPTKSESFFYLCRLGRCLMEKNRSLITTMLLRQKLDFIDWFGRYKKDQN